MREILFRGKTELGKWVYGSLIHAGDYCSILEREEDVHPMDYPFLDQEIGWIDGKATPIKLETIGQFTGLVDKNGAKIFEGDIVRLDDSMNTDHKNFEVIFGYGQFYIGINKPIVYVRYSCEVVGNIYDNLELLEE